MTFESFQLDPAVIDALREMGFQTPTSIQEKAIPLILEGKDLIATAETGSGKTAACAIPISHMIEKDDPNIQALVIVPTRELALQYATETQKIGRFKDVKTFALYGGEGNLELQVAKLKAGVHVLIATPGRLIDFIFSKAIHLSHVKILVLDEADQMLSMGFYDDLAFIMQCLIQKHQTLLFSATMPKEIRNIAKQHLVSPVELSLIEKKPAPSTLSHFFYFCRVFAKKRMEFLTLIKELDPPQCIIFANSRHEVEDLYRELKTHFSGVDFLHGGMEQSVRNIVCTKFAKGKIRYLIATDIASRGLDFSKVTHVLNYHFPLDQETYFHRAGRAGRIGREGTCITVVTKRDLPKIERLTKKLPSCQWINSPPSRYS